MNMMNEIKNRFTGTVIVSGNEELKTLVESNRDILSGAYLSGANLTDSIK